MAYDFPDTPTNGQTTIAAGQVFQYNGTLLRWEYVGPYIALSVTSGSISGSAVEGSTLTYTPGVASGGISPYTYSWVWKKVSDDSILQTDGATYVIPSTLVGDNVYVTITATDASLSTATADTANYPAAPATILSAGITNALAPTSIPGTVNFTWADGASNASSTGCIEFSKNGGPFTQAATAVVDGDTITTQWTTGPAGTCGDAPDGSTITGSLTNGTRTTNFSLLLDKSPSAFSFNDLTAQALSAPATSNTVTLSGFNATSYVTLGTSTLTTVEASINGGSWAPIPATGTTMPINPGSTIQIRGTTGAASSTAYTSTVSIGSTSTTWSVTTTAAVPSIQTPTIQTPANSATGVGSSGGITITGDTYTPLNGAGSVQTSSTWEVYKWIGGGAATAPTTEPPDAASYTAVTGSPFTVSVAPFTSLSIAKPPLEANTTYYVRVKYDTTNATAATSSYSAWSEFTTGDLLPVMSRVGTGSFPTTGAVAFDGTNYVLPGGNYRRPYTSTDLTTWTARPYLTFSGPLYANIWTGTQFLMAGRYGGGVLTDPGSWNSTDGGATWTATNAPSPDLDSTWTTGFVYKDSSNILALRANGTSLSTDGGATWQTQIDTLSKTWTGGTLRTPNHGKALTGVFFNSFWLIPGTVNGTSTAAVARTTDPTLTTGWFTTDTGVSGQFSSIATDGTIAVAVGSNSSAGSLIYSSTDGITWTSRLDVPGSNKVLYSVAYGGGYFMAVGDNGTNYVSTDGITWVDLSANYPTFPNYFVGVIYTAGKFLASASGVSASAVYSVTA